MSKKEMIFTLGLTMLMSIIWITGELVMGLWIPVTRKAHLIWLICIVVVTLVVNVWHSMKKDESDRKDPKREKYERKVNKRK